MSVLKTLPSESIDLIVTSPPYWGLRDYGANCSTVWGGSKTCEHEWIENERKLHSGTSAGEKQMSIRGNFHNMAKTICGFCSKCGAWRGQLGLEPTFQLYIDHLVEIFGEVKRVLKSSGSFYLNIGDTYSGSGCGYGDKRGTNKREETLENIKLYQSIRKPQTSMNLPSKCLIGIPERLMLRLVDEQGWIRRNTIIWHKPNCMPSSVRDRRSNSYEPVFHFVQSQKYYYDLDSIRIPHKTSLIDLERRINADRLGTTKTKKNGSLLGGPQFSTKGIKYRYQGEFNNLQDESKQYDNSFFQDTVNEPQFIESLANTGANNKEPYKKNNPHLMRLKQDNVPGRNTPTYKGFNEGGKNPSDVIEVAAYNYKQDENASKQPFQGLVQSRIVERSRVQSRIDAVEMFPDSPEKQKEYIKYIHDHYGHPRGKNPTDVMNVGSEVRPKSKLGVPSRFGDNHPSKNPERWFGDGGKNPSDFIDISTKGYKEAHFAVYPEALVHPFILSSSPKDGVVLDPFSGSGTTAKVAKDLGRSSISIDINVNYSALWRKRLKADESLTPEDYLVEM